jgi:hypothetical protein
MNYSAARGRVRVVAAAIALWTVKEWERGKEG